MSNNKVVLTPLIGLMRERSQEEVELYTIEEIKKHRQLRDEASRLDTKFSQLEVGDPRRGAAERDYVRSLIAMHAQQTVVSTLLDILGYVPDVTVGTSH